MVVHRHHLRKAILGHNGSIMQMNVDSRTGAFNIVYAQPKPSLLAIGVVPGTLLITGQMHPRAGTAHPSHCPCL